MFSYPYPYPYPYPNHQFYPNQQYPNPYNVYDNNASKLSSNSNFNSMNPTSSSSCGNSTYHYNHQMFPFQNTFINPSSHCDVNLKPQNSLNNYNQTVFNQHHNENKKEKTIDTDE